MGVIIKAGFGVLAAALYGFAALLMIKGAIGTPGYVPAGAAPYVMTTAGAGITAFVAAQLGVAVASPGSGLRDSLAEYSADAQVTNEDKTRAQLTTSVLVLDVVVLVLAGGFFTWLWFSPGAIASASTPLTEAPAYVSEQARAFVALVLAGAGGIGVAATK